MESENTQVAIPIYYEVYKQDLLHDYVDLELLGIVKTVDEARNCCKLFREAIETSASRGLGDYRSRFAVFFRPVIERK